MTTGAPALVGDVWLGTGGRRLNLADLRGRIVLLDFWTLCCVNCHHVLAELRPIEERFADVLTVVGVHSPKFEHEKDAESVRSAMERHGITHPVLNDPEMATWRGYGVRAWPTLVLLDAEGRIAATYSGEGHGHAIEAKIEELVAQGEESGTLLRGPDVFVPLEASDSPYRQPGKLLVLGDGRLLISDSGNHRLVIADADAPDVPLAVIGTGARGRADGAAGTASFNEPYGAAQLPAALAARVGVDVVVADTANHLVRGLRLDDLTVTTLAGTGEQWMQSDPTSGSATLTRLSTPWDVVLLDDQVLIAMAGDHRIWRLDPVARHVEVFAGTTHEGLTDGTLAEAWFAQPSGLAAIDHVVYVVDAETSAIRRIDSDRVDTVVGTGLFDFGHVDGPTTQARLQHPLGICALPDGSLAVADTYNGAVRRIDLATGTVSTIARGLREPSDVRLVGEQLLVLESAIGTVTTVPIAAGVAVQGEAMRTQRPALRVAPGPVTIEVTFTPPPGQKRDDRYGPSTYLTVGASPVTLLTSGEGSGSDLVREIVIDADAVEGVLHVAAKGASCDIPREGDDEFHAACHIHQQDWGVPIVIDPDGTNIVKLTLAG